jgi:hypothetical protein
VRTRVALALIVAALAWQLAPLYQAPYFGEAVVGTDSYRSHDWLEVAKLDHYARKSLLEWKRWPLWNPLLAGGQPQLAHPSDGSASPLIVSSLLFGEIRGLKINVGLVALLGALGVFGIARRVLRLDVAPTAVAALAWCWAGWLPARVAVGFYESCLMAAWPLVLWLWLDPAPDDVRRRRWALGAVVLWALAIQLQLAVPVLVLWMALLLGVEAALARRAEEPLPKEDALGGLALLAVAGLLGAVKFLPMLALLREGGFRDVAIYPTHPDAWYRNFEQLWFGLFHHVPNVPVLDSDGNPRIQEYMTLQPGPATLLLAVPGAVWAARRRAWQPWLAAGAAFLWLSFGPHAPVDGFRVLHPLPLFSAMRGPLRYFNYPVLITLCLLGGAGAQAVLARLPQRASPALVAAFLALNAPGAMDARTLLRSAFLYAPQTLPPSAEPTSEGLSTRSTGDAPRLNLRKYTNVRRGMPTVYTPEDLPIEVAPLPARWIGPDGSSTPEEDYRGEAWTEGGRAALVALRSSEVVVRHRRTEPGLVYVNQNAWPGWACGDRPVSEDAGEETGLLAFEAPAGDGETTCRWRPRTLWPGVGGSLLGLVGLAWLGRRRPGRRRD